MSNSEQVILVIPTSEFLRKTFSRAWGNFSKVEQNGLEEFKGFVNDTGIWMKRDLAEKDESYLQIIPYIVVIRAAWSSQFEGLTYVEYFYYTRTSKGGEGRLHDKKSVGLGGHVDWDDSDPEKRSVWSAVEEAAIRELDEEVSIRYGNRPVNHKDSVSLSSPYGLIYTPDDSVGRVHLGVLFEYTLGRDCELEVREKDKIIGDFVSEDNLRAALPYTSEKGNLEKWSHVALKQLL